MAGVSVKMGVTGVSQFKQGMKDAESSVKALESALKLNESQLKLNGDRETYMKNRAILLKDAIEKQTEVVKQGMQALEAMKAQGIDEASKAFQDMKTKVNNSVTKLNEMKTSLKDVETGAGGAESGAKGMNEELQKVGQGIGWQNVSDGLEKITSKMESAARAAVNLGKKITRYVTDSAEWADSLKTMASEYDIDTETLQRMQNVSEFIDTDVTAILNAQQRMRKAAASSNGKKTIEETLGISLTGQNPDDLFWEIGEALLAMGDAYDKEAAAQAVFGRGWRELQPLFKAGREEYERMLEEQKVLSNEDVDKLGQIDDMTNEIQQQIELMKNQFIADNADKIMELMQWLIDNKDAVVSALTVIGGAFAALKLGTLAINIGQIVNGMKNIGILGGGGGTPTGGTPTTGTGGSGGGWLSNFVGNAMKVAPYAAPVILFADQMAQSQQVINDMMAKGAESLAATARKTEQYKDSDLFDIWDTLNDYLTISGDSAGDRAKMDAFAERFTKWMSDEISDTALDKMFGLMSLDQKRAFVSSIRDYQNGVMLYSEEDQEAFYGPLQTALDLVEESMGANTESNNSVTEAAASLMTLPEQVAAAVASALGGGGVSSNLYIENMNTGSGQDAGWLANLINARLRQVQNGYGS